MTQIHKGDIVKKLSIIISFSLLLSSQLFAQRAELIDGENDFIVPIREEFPIADTPIEDTPIEEEIPYNSVVISHPYELEELGLQANSEISHYFLQALQEVLMSGTKENNYHLLLQPLHHMPEEPAILVQEKFQLKSILRTSKNPEYTCSSWYDIDPSDMGVGGGQRRKKMKALTQGVCGAIASLHSIVKLKLVQKEKVFKGKYFRKKAIKAIQKLQRTKYSMTEAELIRAHNAAGAKICRRSGKVRARDTFGLNSFNKSLYKYMNDPKNTWDCTIFVRSWKRGSTTPTLAHAEHVTDVKLKRDTTDPRRKFIWDAEIKTANGLDQGNLTTTVPKDPGTNTWSSKPGKNPSCKLTGSTHQDKDKYLKVVPAVTQINFVCCRQ